MAFPVKSVISVSLIVKGYIFSDKFSINIDGYP